MTESSVGATTAVAEADATDTKTTAEPTESSDTAAASNASAEEETAETKQPAAKQAQTDEVAGQTSETSSDADSDEDDEEFSEQSFAELLAEEENKAIQKVRKGQRLEGRVVAITGDTAFIDIGMRSEAALPVPDEPPVPVEEGKNVIVYVVNPNGQVKLSLEPLMGYGDISGIESSWEAKEPVEGKVTGLVSGGYNVAIDGVRCFCPHSQMDLRPVPEPQDMIGQTLRFKIIRFERAKKNVVLSRRELLEDELRARREEARQQITAGAVLTGRVADIQSFGAFIDFGGIQGLLHISEIAHHKIPSVEDVLQVGDDVEVKILDITHESNGKERISLSRRVLLPDPFDDLGFEEGDLIEGEVVRLSRFGVFINLKPAVDGLLPRRFMKRSGQPIEMDSFTEGERINVEVVEIDWRDKKIALALPGWDEAIKSDLRPGDAMKAEVIKVIPAGVLVQCVDDPARGLIHKRTIRNASMKQIADAFQPGTQLDVVLEEVDDRGRYNFLLQGEMNGADASTMGQFMEGGQDSLGHNPFASFFNEDD